MKKASIYILLALSILIIGCQGNTEKSKVKTNFPAYTFEKPDSLEYQWLNFKYYSIKVPTDWKKETVKGIDSYVTQIITSQNDTLTSDLGWYSNKLEPGQTAPRFISQKELKSLNEKQLINLKEEEFIVYKDWNEIEIKNYFKTTEKFYLIDNRKARVVKPKKNGVSITGVYVENLWKNNNNFVHFNLYGEDLSEKIQNELLYSISSIKFKK